MRFKPIAVCVLTGVLTVGGAGAAAAASTSTGGPSESSARTTGTYNCANAPHALTRIAKLEAKAQAWVPKAQQRETQATQAGHPKVAARIGRRITRVETLEAKGTKLADKIEGLCPGAAPATGSSSGSGTAS
jgi:hypothetical protein